MGTMGLKAGRTMPVAFTARTECAESEREKDGESKRGKSARTTAPTRTKDREPRRTCLSPFLSNCLFRGYRRYENITYTASKIPAISSSVFEFALKRRTKHCAVCTNILQQRFSHSVKDILVDIVRKDIHPAKLPSRYSI